MGWTNSHLHQFICWEHAYADPSAQLEQYLGDPPVLDESKVPLSELLNDIRQGPLYEYDFGDYREHIVTLENILPVDASASAATAVCLAGSRACPPEDCGGNRGLRGIARST